MTKVVMLIASNDRVSLSNVQNALSLKLGNPTIFEPIGSKSQYSVKWEDALELLSNNQSGILLEQIIANYQAIAKDAKTILVIGVTNHELPNLARQTNQKIAATLAAQIIYVPIAETTQQLKLAFYSLTEAARKNLVGLIVQGRVVDKSLPVLANINADDSAEQISNKIGSSLANVLVDVDASKMSAPVFRYKLTQLAKQANKRIVLPEGDEPRTIKAASICAKNKIANCILLGEPSKILDVAQAQGVDINIDGIEIIDPAQAHEQYIPRFVELRQNKGLTEEQAREQIKDNVVLGTLMLENDTVDGLVSGAVNTTANTIRPPLQLIKTKDKNTAVSSVFFMLMPDQVYVYGDCAVTPNPTVEQLADIAIQSADSAKAFGITPRVAMLSYSTINSGFGPSVDQVKQAVDIVKQKRPDILIDGPLQYDAAVMPNVAKTKAPNSLVAGKATVFIFPDLNAGNIAYKAVQRSANLVSIGPMLQGMRKPVNDLSRGALVDDIVYTIALTAIQATQ